MLLWLIGCLHGSDVAPWARAYERQLEHEYREQPREIIAARTSTGDEILIAVDALGRPTFVGWRVDGPDGPNDVEWSATLYHIASTR